MTAIFHTGAELLELAAKTGLPLHELALAKELALTRRPLAEIKELLTGRLQIMEKSIARGLKNTARTMGGMAGGESKDLAKTLLEPKKLRVLSPLAARAALYALANNENNACMGCIAACPTAGSSGVVPGVLFALRDEQKISAEKMLEGLVVASAIGALIVENATVSGAEGGCQAEIGGAAAMAAAAATHILGGNAEESIHAATLALKNLLGLACDPIGGMVEVPCIKRNAFAATHALTAAELSLAGLRSFVPFDEVVDALKNIGRSLPPSLRETAKGGLAVTPTGKAVAKQLKIKP